MTENNVQRKSKISTCVVCLFVCLFVCFVFFPISDSESSLKDFHKVSTILWPRYELGLLVICQS